AAKVGWDDARAFCQWLTERERKSGKVGTNEAYRLPSDHEWSCAAGIGSRENAAESPQAKDKRIDDEFPWGSQWPPPPDTDNLAGEELRPSLAAGKFAYIKDVLGGYRDGHPTLAPVGSYPPNSLGLHDLGGNLWEWCEDFLDASHKEAVTRGASWSNYNRTSFLS